MPLSDRSTRERYGHRVGVVVLSEAGPDGYRVTSVGRVVLEASGEIESLVAHEGAYKAPRVRAVFDYLVEVCRRVPED